MSLYNDERPRTFSAVLGQDVIVRQMKRKIAEGRFPHTALLTGPRGTGKTTCAGIIGKALNCDDLGEDGEPCCRCESCRSIEKGMSPAVLELDAATHNGVEDVRALVEQSQFVPAGRKKVFILDEVHMFSTAAWNALLKTLEDPPQNVVFILATTELQKVPLTVLSRTLRFEFRKIGREVMQGYIYDLCIKYRIGIEPGALSLVVTSAEGCMRDALSLLEQFIGCEELETETVREFLGLTSEEVIFDMLESMRDGDGGKALRIVEECERMGRNMLLVVKAVLEALSYATAYKAGGALPALSDAYCGRLKEFADSIPASRIGQFCGTFLQVYPLLARNAQLTFFLKAAITNLIGSESLLGRLEREVSCLKAGIHSVDRAVEMTPPVEQEPADAALPGTGGEDKGMAGAGMVFSGKEEDAGCTDEKAVDEGVFEGVPEFEDYDGAIQRPDMDGSGQCESSDNVETGPRQTAGVATPEDYADGEMPEQGTVAERNGIPDVQDGQVIGVDELFRMVDAVCGDPAGDGAGNIVQFKTRGEEEPAGQGYVAEREDDPFAAFDYYMAGGSARR